MLFGVDWWVVVFGVLLCGVLWCLWCCGLVWVGFGLWFSGGWGGLVWVFVVGVSGWVGDYLVVL